MEHRFHLCTARENGTRCPLEHSRDSWKSEDYCDAIESQGSTLIKWDIMGNRCPWDIARPSRNKAPFFKVCPQGI